MKKPSEILIAAAGLLADGWTQGADARDANGMGVSISSERAVSFCAYGAISRVVGRARRGGFLPLSYPAIGYANRAAGWSLGDAPATWNDRSDMTQQKILDIFQDAAILAKEDE